MPNINRAFFRVHHVLNMFLWLLYFLVLLIIFIYYYLLICKIKHTITFAYHQSTTITCETGGKGVATKMVEDEHDGVPSSFPACIFPYFRITISHNVAILLTVRPPTADCRLVPLPHVILLIGRREPRVEPRGTGPTRPRPPEARVSLGETGLCSTYAARL